jgi:hypothetical protein
LIFAAEMDTFGNSSLMSIEISKRIGEASDRSTDCSDLEDVEVHADIDEEDDDVFFSVHKRSSTIADSAIEQAAADEGMSYIVNAEIDEEDDDVFFSVHRRPSFELVFSADAPLQEGIDSIMVHADIDDDDVSLSTHKQISRCANGSSEQAMVHDKECCTKAGGQESRRDHPSSGHDEAADQLNANLSSTSQRDHTTSLRERESTTSVGSTASLRRRANSISSVGSENARNEFNLLGDLKGKRTGGVKRHLAKKLSQEDDM